MSLQVVRMTLACVAVLAVSGCMSVYKLPAGTPSTGIVVPKGVTSWICANTEPRALQRDKDGKARIPAGQRVVIGANFASSDGYMSYYCSASASIEPSVDHEYHQDFQTEGNHCSALIYRRDPDDARIGLAFEPTMRADTSACVYKKR